jgi:hypothetical protein
VVQVIIQYLAQEVITVSLEPEYNLVPLEHSVVVRVLLNWMSVNYAQKDSSVPVPAYKVRMGRALRDSIALLVL